LEIRPDKRVAFTITNNPQVVLDGTRVRPTGGLPGGGREWMGVDVVEVEVISVDNLE
jgi:hypothetical protein